MHQKRISSISVITEDVLAADQVYEALTIVGREFLREGYDAVNLSSHGFDDEVVNDDNKLLSYKVHEILCRLGMTETEAHNAITQIHAAGIQFVKD